MFYEQCAKKYRNAPSWYTSNCDHNWDLGVEIVNEVIRKTVHKYGDTFTITLLTDNVEIVVD